MNYPAEFIDYLADMFGLEYVDYLEDVYYHEWITNNNKQLKTKTL